ncbi:MAG: radical SAM protein [Methanobacteriota archaeon]|nr:MAG: radical SAM protein [Euryarchaeota archaeon]
MRVLVLDGYTDEPSCLGVPPYISPYVRLAYGAISEAGSDAGYATIDQWRSKAVNLARYDLLLAIRHVAVPGKYLRGMPASDKELVAIGRGFAGESIVSLGAAGARVSKDVTDSYDRVVHEDSDAYIRDLLIDGDAMGRRRTKDEWRRWLLRGAHACALHPDHGGPLIAEIQMYRGCVRYLSGGCEFCVEPLQGEPQFRAPMDIVAEVVELSRGGVRSFRLGAQTCVYSYMADGIGETETPLPNHELVTRLLKAIRESARPDVFHLDNANPAVIAAHPRESKEITKAIAEYCTGGNVLALGLESADPEVARANNLNSTPEDAIAAIRMINEVGATNGPTGMPLVLPGINFLCGLKGETKRTYAANTEFMRELVDEGLLVRRTNIRQVIPARSCFPGVRFRAEFSRFKRYVREEVDLPMLGRIVPNGTVLSAVYTELKEGGRTFGRQVGTYPLLIGLPYTYKVGVWVNVLVTGRSPKSVVGIVYPTPVNSSSLSMLEAVPGIGRRRAMAIVRKRPFGSKSELQEMMGGGAVEEAALKLLSVDDELIE